MKIWTYYLAEINLGYEGVLYLLVRGKEGNYYLLIHYNRLYLHIIQMLLAQPPSQSEIV